MNCSYVLSSDLCTLIDAMARMGARLRLHFPEDAVVASWFYGFEIVRVNDHRFHDVPGKGAFPSMCQPNDILVHSMESQHWGMVGQDGVLRCGGDGVGVNRPPSSIQSVPPALYMRGQNWEHRPSPFVNRTRPA